LFGGAQAVKCPVCGGFIGLARGIYCSRKCYLKVYLKEWKKRNWEHFKAYQREYIREVRKKDRERYKNADIPEQGLPKEVFEKYLV
jgi:hypothetical protein